MQGFLKIIAALQIQIFIEYDKLVHKTNCDLQITMSIFILSPLFRCDLRL